MSRKDDLEESILECYKVMWEYETKVRNSDDFREKARARRIMQDQQAFISKYLAEYRLLLAETNMAREIAEIALSYPGLSDYVSIQGQADMGVEGIYASRGEALEKFTKPLYEEIDKAAHGEKAFTWFVCSSMRGFLVPSYAIFDGQEIIECISNSKCDIRILMTDFCMADMRAEQENRGKGEIPNEIKTYIGALHYTAGISKDKIKLYPGTPTVFAIATTEKMLLNPYPYEKESHRCFSLIVKNTSNLNDIYHQYLENHFEKPWKRGREIRPDEWDFIKQVAEPTDPS